MIQRSNQALVYFEVVFKISARTSVFFFEGKKVSSWAQTVPQNPPLSCGVLSASQDNPRLQTLHLIGCNAVLEMVFENIARIVNDSELFPVCG